MSNYQPGQALTYLRELSTIIILVILDDMASKLEKSGPIFFKFQLFPSLPSVATDDRKQFQCREIVFNNKLDHYFWNSTDAKTTFSF